jgi:hypothetical protein
MSNSYDYEPDFDPNVGTRVVHLPSYIYHDGRGHRISYEDVAYVIHQKLHTISFNRQIYLYREGIYGHDKGEIDQEIISMIDAAKRVGVSCHTIKGPKSEIREHLLSLGLEIDYPFNRLSGIIPVLNGILSIDLENRSITLIADSPAFKLNYKIPVIYDPDADPTTIKRILREWLVDQSFIVPQIVGQALLQIQGNVYKKAYMFLGDGDAGKSSCLDFLQSFFGVDLVSKVSLNMLVGSQFSTSFLESKALNLSDDASSDKLRQSEKFKELTGTSMHLVEKKHCTPYVGMVNPVYIMACNRPPDLDRRNLDYQFLERWIIVTFQGVFKVNPRFKEELFTDENKSALLNLAIDAMIDIHHQGLTEIIREESNEVIWLKKYTPLYREFISVYMVRDSGNHIKKDVLYRVYAAVCRELGWNCREKSVFFKDLKKHGIDGGRLSRGEREYIIPGWSLNLDALSGLSEQYSFFPSFILHRCDDLGMSCTT